MRSWIEAHGSGYRYKIELDKGPDGKRKTISKGGFKKQKEAKNALAEKMTEINKGNYIEDTGLTVKKYLEHWVNVHKSNIAPSTFKRYKEFCNTINNYIGNVELLKLNPITIQNFYSELLSTDLSKSTVLKIHRCFNLALKQAVGWGMLNNNPCSNVKAPRPDVVEMSVWDEDTAKKFLMSCKDEMIFIPIALALGTGMREGEICALKWDSVDLRNGEVFVKRTLQKIDGKLTLKEPKTKGSVRKISIAKDLVEILKQYKIKQKTAIMENRKKYNDENFVCAWEDDGRPYDPLYIAKKFPKVLADYDVPKIRFHDLRHTHATILLLHEVPAKVVSERLGHSNISITLDTYSHVLPNMQKAAAEKLNGLFGAL